jgi:hypothetical protein
MLAECLLGPQILAHLDGERVAFLTDLGFAPRVKAAGVYEAAHQQAEQAGIEPPGRVWKLSKVVGNGTSFLGAEMGLACTGDGGWLAAQRLAALLAPGAQPTPVRKALSQVLPLIHTGLTLRSPDISAARVGRVLEGVLAGPLNLSPPHKAAGCGKMTLAAPLFPETYTDLQRLQDRMAPHYHLVPINIPFMLERGAQFGEHLDQQEEEEGVGQEKGEEGVVGQEEGGQVEQQVEVEEEVPPQPPQRLSYERKEALLKQAGYAILGLMVFAPTGRLVQLITDPLPAAVLAAAGPGL